MESPEVPLEADGNRSLSAAVGLHPSSEISRSSRNAMETITNPEQSIAHAVLLGTLNIADAHWF